MQARGVSGSGEDTRRIGHEFLWRGKNCWSQRSDLNRRPTVYETVALPTELRWRGAHYI